VVVLLPPEKLLINPEQVKLVPAVSWHVIKLPDDETPILAEGYVQFKEHVPPVTALVPPGALLGTWVIDAPDFIGQLVALAGIALVNVVELLQLTIYWVAALGKPTEPKALPPGDAYKYATNPILQFDVPGAHVTQVGQVIPHVNEVL